MQQRAGRAERERASAEPGPAQAAAAEHARRTRDDAVALGEELARERTKLGGEASLAARWQALHERSARRLLDLCMANGGVYVKLGQHVAQLDYLVPAPFTMTLSALFEHNSVSPTESIVALVEEELGAPLDALLLI